MAGLLVFGGLAAYTWLFVYVFRQARSLVGKAATVAVALAIPFWDFPIGYLKFHHHCDRDSGMYILEKVPATNAILLSGISYPASYVTRFGFETVEYVKRDGVIRERIGEPRQSFHRVPVSTLKVDFTGRSLFGNLREESYLVTRIADGRVIAKQVHYLWFGMWWQAMMTPYFGGVRECSRLDMEALLAHIARGS